MKALIIGAGMANKGAELMLRALVSEMRARHPSVELGISRVAPGIKRAADLELKKLAIPLPHVASKAFRAVFALRGLPTPTFGGRSWSWCDIDLLLDISGFSYSDQWGTLPAKHLALLAEDVRRRGGEVILFPQAFGPFELPGHSDLMRRALQASSLVFARDSASHRHLLNLGVREPLHAAPDLTVGFGVVHRDAGSWVGLVPNVRMLDQGATVWGDSYIAILAEQARRVKASGLEVRLIVHDQGGEDELLAREIASAASIGEVIVTSDPLALKAQLSEARMVIGSRFHAITSALACGVPVLALGWSHKYSALLERYGVGDFCFLAPSPAISSRVDDLLDSETRLLLREALIRTNQELCQDAERMWSTISDLLRQPDEIRHA